MDKVEEESRGEKERAKERREGGGSLGKTGRGGGMVSIQTVAGTFRSAGRRRAAASTINNCMAELRDLRWADTIRYIEHGSVL